MTEARPALPKIGGWLFLAGLGLVFGAFMLGRSLITDLFPLLFGGEFGTFFEPSHPGFHPCLGSVLVFEAVAQPTFLGGTLYVLYLFGLRSVRTPRNYIRLAALALAFQWVDLVLVGAISDDAKVGKSALASVVRTSVVATIWILYFRRSQRVRTTFIVER